jgi:hypothetical protein
VGKRAIFKPILNDSNPWGATLQGFFIAQKRCPRISPTTQAAQFLPKKNSCFISKWLYNKVCSNTFIKLHFEGI